MRIDANTRSFSLDAYVNGNMSHKKNNLVGAEGETLLNVFCAAVEVKELFL
jgi:hypothetical protein